MQHNCRINVVVKFTVNYHPPHPLPNFVHMIVTDVGGRTKSRRLKKNTTFVSAERHLGPPSGTYLVIEILSSAPPPPLAAAA